MSHEYRPQITMVDVSPTDSVNPLDVSRLHIALERTLYVIMRDGTFIEAEVKPNETVRYAKGRLKTELSAPLC